MVVLTTLEILKDKFDLSKTAANSLKKSCVLNELGSQIIYHCNLL